MQCDEIAIGKMACDHFLRLGFRELAYCGLLDVSFAQQRLAGFMEEAKRHGLSVNVYPGPVYAEMLQHAHAVKSFREWLGALPPSVGLFCPVSHLSLVVVHHCREMGIPLPGKVAILGVDDDEIICGLSRPQLSAIDQAPERLGYEAAAILDRILAGEPGADRAPAHPAARRRCAGLNGPPEHRQSQRGGGHPLHSQPHRRRHQRE